ncbi:hypothetical protein Tco_0844968 [Tanacetum coccineum]
MKSRVRIEGLKKKKKRFNTTAGNPVKKILLKLNLSDHRLCKIVVEVPDSSWLTRSITTCSYPTNKHKVIMKAQKKFKKDATSKVFQRMVWSMSVPDVASPHRCKIYKMARDCSLVDDLKRIMNPL